MTSSQHALLLFNSDERSYLNSLAHGLSLAELSRKRVLEMLAFADLAVDANDVPVVELVGGLQSKISSMPDSDWDAVKSALPFNVPYDDPDEDSPIASSGIVLPTNNDGEWVA